MINTKCINFHLSKTWFSAKIANYRKQKPLTGGGVREDQPPPSLIFFQTSQLPDEINASLKLPGFACNDRRSCSLTA